MWSKLLQHQLEKPRAHQKCRNLGTKVKSTFTIEPLIISPLIKPRPAALTDPAQGSGAWGAVLSRIQAPRTHLSVMLATPCWVMAVVLLWCQEGHGSPRTLGSRGGQDSWPRSVLRIVTWCWGPPLSTTSAFLCREVRVRRGQEGSRLWLQELLGLNGSRGGHGFSSPALPHSPSAGKRVKLPAPWGHSAGKISPQAQQVLRPQMAN